MSTSPALNLKRISLENYKFLQSYIQRQSGIALEINKEYLIESRLSPVLKEEKLDNLNDLCLRLRNAASPLLRQRIVEAMTTHETFFFRDDATFEAIRFVVLPKLVDSIRPPRKIRIWSAACSSGQEAYSLAMMLLDAGVESSRFEIVGTDLSSQIVERARTGEYSEAEIARGLAPAQLAKYFKKTGSGWQIVPLIRALVRFEQGDLREPKIHAYPFDLLLCRNVLIYFDVTTKKQILQHLAAQLSQGGYMVLGAAETVINLGTPLTGTVLRGATFYNLPS